jgi:hypothetical protein
MVGNFKDYVKAQADEILRSVKDEVRCDPDRLRREAIAWIEKNAEAFRKRWDRVHAS